MDLQETKEKESYRFMALTKDLNLFRKVASKKNVSVALLVRAAMMQFKNRTDFQEALKLEESQG